MSSRQPSLRCRTCARATAFRVVEVLDQPQRVHDIDGLELNVRIEHVAEDSPSRNAEKLEVALGRRMADF
jgi:hypothetical protein